MEDVWFTADTHFGHANIIEYCSRPFASVEEMDREIIDNWNRRVGKEDIVFHLGDLGNPRMESPEAQHYLEQLNGTICIIPGNHDVYWARDADALHSGSGEYVSLFQPEHEIKIGNRPVVLSHYAMRVWNGSYHSTWHLFGHSHGRLPEWGLSLDVGVDCNGFEPISAKQVERELLVVESVARAQGGEGYLRFEHLSGWTQNDRYGKVGS
jgi:calcineurin-like phosphoesterase family protein